ncbi:MAG: hypothetical protein ABI239_03170, partial [Aquihabitans sp.]
MTEIPEHLRKRAEEARAKAAAAKGDGGGESTPAPAEAAPASEAESKIPAHLLERAKAARSKAAGASGDAGGGSDVATAPAAGGSSVATAAPPIAAGPGGHTQRLLTVVKSGSIQDVKAKPQDKVHVWPHLLSIEFVAALLCLGFLFIFSIFVNAPLLEQADINKTPNPSKAPWYFLGLQEMLVYFDPWMAGVVLPTMIIIGLVALPYIDFNREGNGFYTFKKRWFAITTFMFGFLVLWVTLIVLGTFLRGPNWNFFGPFAYWDPHVVLPLNNINVSDLF